MAPYPVIVYGTVIKNSVIQSGITVTLENLTHTATDTRITDASGNYIFDDLPPGYAQGDQIKISVLSDTYKTFNVPALTPPPDPQLIDFTIDTKEFSGLYDIFLQKEFSGLYDIFLQKEFSGLYDIFLQKEFTGLYDLLLKKEYSGLYDIFQQKEFTGQYNIIAFLQKEFTGFYDLFVQKEFSGLYDLFLTKEFTGYHDILLQKEFSGLHDILLQKEFSGLHDIFIKKEFTGQYNIIVLGTVLKEFSGLYNIFIQKEFSGLHDILLQKEFSGLYDIFTQKEFSGLHDILLQKEFSGIHDINVLKEITGKYTILAQFDNKEFSGLHDILLQKEFTSKYNISTPAIQNIFTVFDHPKGILRVNVTSGRTDPITGDWIPESSTDVTIYAHVSDLSLKELTYMDPALVITGLRKIALLSSYGLKVTDIIKITEIDETQSEWAVHQKIHVPGLISKYLKTNRDTFLLRRIT